MMQTWGNGKKPIQFWVQKNFYVFSLHYELDIASSYHPMQYIGKLINQTWENSKKPNFGPDFGLIGPNLGPKIFFVGLTSTTS